jgi:hypothetical protein
MAEVIRDKGDATVDLSKMFGKGEIKMKFRIGGIKGKRTRLYQKGRYSVIKQICLKPDEEQIMVMRGINPGLLLRMALRAKRVIFEFEGGEQRMVP